MFELRPFERRNNHVAAYDPWDQMERAFFGDGSVSYTHLTLPTIRLV